MTKFTMRDLRSPNETLPDKIDTITMTRGDCIFLNTLIGIANKVRDLPDFERENLTIGMLFASEEVRPGTLNLIKRNPGLFRTHVEQFTQDMIQKQEAYFEKHPEKRPPPVEFVDPRTLVKKPEDQQSVDAEAQQSEQTKVETEEV